MQLVAGVDGQVPNEEGAVSEGLAAVAADKETGISASSASSRVGSSAHTWGTDSVAKLAQRGHCSFFHLFILSSSLGLHLGSSNLFSGGQVDAKEMMGWVGNWLDNQGPMSAVTESPAGTQLPPLSEQHLSPPWGMSLFSPGM